MNILIDVIRLVVLLICINSSTQSGPGIVSKVYDTSKFSIHSPSLSLLHPIRGGEIVHLRSIEDTEKVVSENQEADDHLVVVYFSSTNCPPCKKVAPLFAELSEEFEDKVIFCKVDVDENPAAASKYQVTGWPAFLFFKKGEKIMEIVGGKLAEATLYDWVKLMAPKEKGE